MSLIAAGGNPLTHVVDHTWVTVGGDGPFTTFTVMSNHIFMTIVGAVLLLILVPRLTRTPKRDDDIESMTPRGAQNGFETVCLFLRDYVAKPNLGPYTDRFIPYIWSVFFFILTVNLLGMLPLEPLTKPIASAFGLKHGIYGTATGNIWTTAALAICTLVMIVFNGLRLHGMAYVKHFFMGPFPISVVIAALEVIGLFAKTFALAVRLFANMMGGHILLTVLVGFIFTAGSASVWLGLGVVVPVVLGSLAINLLEIFVAVLQAFIFTFLSCVFLGQAVNLHHDEEHDGDQEFGPAHGLGDAHEQSSTVH
jgi:F-type H+-transporting ATPase subunit a